MFHFICGLKCSQTHCGDVCSALEGGVSPEVLAALEIQIRPCCPLLPVLKGVMVFPASSSRYFERVGCRVCYSSYSRSLHLAALHQLLGEPIWCLMMGGLRGALF